MIISAKYCKNCNHTTSPHDYVRATKQNGIDTGLTVVEVWIGCSKCGKPYDESKIKRRYVNEGTSEDC